MSLMLHYCVLILFAAFHHGRRANSSGGHAVANASGETALTSLSSRAGCLVHLPTITVYEWSPISRANSYSAASETSLPTTAVELTTGGFEQDGTWTYETTTSELIFPNALTQGAAFYEWEGFSGTTYGSALSSLQTVQFSSVLSITTQAVTTVPTLRNYDYEWVLISSLTQFRGLGYYRSIYPEQKPLQTCIPDTGINAVLTETQALPPYAILHTSLIGPSLQSSADTVEASTSTGVFSTVSTAQPSPAASLTNSYAAQITSAQSSVSDGIGAGSAPSSPFPGGLLNTEPQGLEPTTTAQPSVRLPSIITTDGGQVPATGSPCASMPEQPLSISTQLGQVLVDGQTLSMSSTVTVGCGSPVTKIVLETNGVGDTVLVFNPSTQTTSDSWNSATQSAMPPSLSATISSSPTDTTPATGGSSMLRASFVYMCYGFIGSLVFLIYS